MVERAHRRGPRPLYQTLTRCQRRRGLGHAQAGPMSHAPDNIVLAHLRSIRTDLSAVKVDTAAIRRHVTSIGLDVARLRQDAAADAVNRSHGEERADLL